jgi:hypothetical protein
MHGKSAAPTYILRPGGAVMPAMNDTTGFFSVLNWRMYSAASSSMVPPISPIRMMPLVRGSWRKNWMASIESVPGKGSPPMPMHRRWPSPARVVCAGVSAVLGYLPRPHLVHLSLHQLSPKGGRESTDRLIRQGTGPRHDADGAWRKDVGGHDAHLAAAPCLWRHDTGAVRTDHTRLGLASQGLRDLRMSWAVISSWCHDAP